MRRRRPGFTLLEVVVAGGLLVVGIMALVALQAQALQVQRRVGVVRRLVSVAEAELERRLALPVPTSGTCSAAHAGEMPIESCKAIVESCAGSRAGLCAATSSERVTRVVVTVEAANGERFELAGLHSRFPRL